MGRATQVVAAALIGIALALVADGASAEGLLTQAARQGAGAKPSQTTITVAQDWQVTCNSAGDQNSCRMSTSGSGLTKDGTAIPVQLASDSGGAEDLFIFLTPLDLLVAKGAELRIDGGQRFKLAYRSCHLQGCVIPFALAGALSSSFRRGTTLSLRLYDLKGGEIDIPMSLVGFIAASRAMKPQ